MKRKVKFEFIILFIWFNLFLFLTLPFSEYYLDYSLSQLHNKNANLFCRKEVEHFVAKLFYISPNQEHVQKLINTTTECSSMMALDGLCKIYFDANIIDLVTMQKSNVWKLLNHFKRIERAERNVCRLTANLM